MPTAAAIEAAIQAATGADSASDSPQASPASGGDSGAESALVTAGDGGVAGGEQTSTSTETTDATRATKHDLLAERLAEIRERRQAARAAAVTKQDRQAAAAERSKWEGLKNGTFLEGMKALGKDPRAVFEEMKDEAINAGKPESQIRQMQERFDSELKRVLSEQVEPLKKTIEELTEENKRAAAREHAARLTSDFERSIQAPDFTALRVEYGEERVMSMIQGFIANPGSIVQHAKALKVNLTHADGRFSMREALTVLKRAQEEHETAKQRRAQASASPNQAAQVPAEKKPAVNGTVERANPLGNVPASSRASDAQAKSPRMSRAERIQKLIDDGSGS